MVQGRGASGPQSPLEALLAALALRTDAGGAPFALELPEEALAAAIEAALERNPPSERLRARNVEVELLPGKARFHADVQATFLLTMRSRASIAVRDLVVRAQGEDLQLAFTVDEPLRMQSLLLDALLQALAVAWRGKRIDPSILLKPGSVLEVQLPGVLASGSAEVRRLLEHARIVAIVILERRLRIELALHAS